MEDIRRRLANSNLYPELPKIAATTASSPISISSSTSSRSSATPPAKMKARARQTVILSDSDSSEVEEVRPAPKLTKGKTVVDDPESSDVEEVQAQRVGEQRRVISDSDSSEVEETHIQAKPNNFPKPKLNTQSSLPNPSAKDHVTWETFDVPEDNNLYDPKTSSEDAEKALRTLCEDTMARDDVVEVDMELAHVPGFKPGIALLPHQIIGRQWMAEREQGKSRGGILADDMGLGKTIQTLTRIVEGRPKKEDKKDGWAAPTLVVCPLALVAQWKSESAKMAEGLKVIEHHGPKRTTYPEDLKRAHIVVTTYQIVAQEYQSYQNDAKDEIIYDSDDSDSFGSTLRKGKKKTKPKKKAEVKDALFRVRWWRVVLDEAHNIKNRKAKMSIAACELQSKYKWCLTGTPLQNSVEELYSLLKFLEIRPLNDWDTFNDRIAKPVKGGRSVRAMKRLHIVLNAVMLRRKKDTLLNGKPLLELPARLVEIVSCEFDKDEREFYDAVQSSVQKSLERMEQTGKIQSSYTQVLVLLLRLRQACDHPALIDKDYRIDQEALEPKPVKNDAEDQDESDELTVAFGKIGIKHRCAVCQEELTSSNAAAEDGDYCVDCISIARKARRKSALSGPSNLPPDSAKIRKIIELLDLIDQRSDGAEKTIIFSQFTTMLDLIEPFLVAEGIKFVRYDGKMTKDKRDESLEKLKKSKSVRVALISFKAGSTGLNLTTCNNVILTDLWWNPALEDQAFDRTHRFGQTRDVYIYKLTIEQTVEQRILELQEQKRKLAEAAYSGDKLKSTKLGLDDLMALFRSGDHDDDDDEDD